MLHHHLIGLFLKIAAEQRGPPFICIARQAQVGIRQGQADRPADALRRRGRLTPVSYTHLDVYKRQGFLLQPGELFLFAPNQHHVLWSAGTQQAPSFLTLSFSMESAPGLLAGGQRFGLEQPLPEMCIRDRYGAGICARILARGHAALPAG